MAVKIRMKRTGGKNESCFRVVATDIRYQRDGNFIEEVGFYDPRHRNETLNLERVNYWLGTGAQISATVAQMKKRIESGKTLKDIVAKPHMSKKAKAKAKAAADAAEAAKAEAAKAAAEAAPAADAAKPAEA